MFDVIEPSITRRRQTRLPLLTSEPDRPLLEPIAMALAMAAGGLPQLVRVVGQLLRESIDAVILTPETGRRLYDELQNSEKTYVGTRVEYRLRAALGLERGKKLDLLIDGQEVDVKFSRHKSWMIPPEAMGHPCILITACETTALCSLGLFIARDEYLTRENRDKKRGISAFGCANILWLFADEPYAKNFWQTISAEAADGIAGGRNGNERVERLFRAVLDRPIPRKIIADVARQADFMRRLRRDAKNGTRDVLARQGIVLLQGKGPREKKLLAALGLPRLQASEWLSHRLRPEERLIAQAAGFAVDV